MRDTGIIDKTGRPIKEHDIITFMAVSIGQNDKSVQTGCVKWSDKDNQWGILNYSTLRGWMPMEFPFFSFDGAGPHEVIGRYPQDMEMMR